MLPVLAMVAGCGGGGGGGSFNPDPPIPSIPRSLDTDFQTVSLMSDIFSQINYDQNVGEAGSGVTVAIFDSGIVQDHPTIDGRVAEPLTITSTRDAGHNNHGTLVALLAAGRIDKTVYGVSYRSPIEFICCVVDTTPDEYAAALIYIGDSSTAFVVNNSWGIVDTYFLQGRTSPTTTALFFFNAPSLLTLSTMERERAKKACATPDSGVQRVCVFSAGNDGFHENGIMTTILGEEFSVEELLDPDRSFLLEASRVALRSRLYQRSQFLNLPAEVSETEGHYIVVAALDDASDELATYSNGCGEAMQYCLAAPGAIPFVICSDPSNSDVCGGRITGTSFAAPLVSGAAALLKSTWPNLDATQVVTILLTTATDLGEPGVDQDYGWGKLDVGESIMPQGSVLSSTGRSLAETLVDAGPGLAGALARSTATFGMFDEHGRPYMYFVSGHSYSRHVDAGAALKDFRFAAASLMELAPERRMGLLGTGLTRKVNDAGHWPAIAGKLGSGGMNIDYGLERCFASCPQLRDTRAASLFSPTALAWSQQHVPAPYGRIGMMLEAGMEDGSGHTHASGGLFVSSKVGDKLLRLEAGGISESGTFLGSDFGGALAVGKGHGHYLSAQLGTKIGEGTFSASYTMGRSRPGLEAGSYVIDATEARYDGYRLELGGERWSAYHTVPLSATGGGLMVESVGGYTGANGDWSVVKAEEGVAIVGSPSADDWDYRTDRHWIDFGSAPRESRLGFMATRPFGGRIDLLFGAEHISNSPRERYEKDEVRMFASISIGR